MESQWSVLPRFSQAGYRLCLAGDFTVVEWSNFYRSAKSFLETCMRGGNEAVMDLSKVAAMGACFVNCLLTMAAGLGEGKTLVLTGISREIAHLFPHGMKAQNLKIVHPDYSGGHDGQVADVSVRHSEA